MTLMFAAAFLKKDNSIVDIAWGPGFVLITVLTFFLKPGFTFRHILVSGLIILWGLRLMIHIFLRNRGKGEDFRYAEWRRDWGKWFVLRSYFQVFMLQGFFMIVIAWPIILTNSSRESGLGWLEVSGAGLWLIGFCFESVGDAQLTRFKKDPVNKGKIMTEGLWMYTRHPNYFGEVVMWWGIFLIALAVPDGWTAVVSPILITVLLLRVSGVTMLEKKYKDNPEFEAYARRTSAFFPWPPRKL
jgi:steroid 5-alpha reductase family enzyme